VNGRLTPSIRKWLVVAVLLGLGSCAKAPDPPRVTIRSRTWRVELAVTAEQRYRGLSGREYLPEDAGMLFIHGRPQVLNYCMRGCVIPLDIAFIGPDYRVVATHTMSVEDGLIGRVVYSSRVPAQYALEVRAGALRLAGVRIGDKVTFSGNIPRGS